MSVSSLYLVIKLKIAFVTSKFLLCLLTAILYDVVNLQNVLAGSGHLNNFVQSGLCS